MMIKGISDTISLWIFPSVIIIILTCAILKKIPVYETFIDGAKNGAKVTLNIIPYLVGIIVAISMLRASGIIENIATYGQNIFEKINLPADILPLAIVRSLSGSAAIGVFSDIITNNDINSYVTKLSAVMLGSSETTFYVLTVYFGSIGIKKYRYAILTGLSADIIGIIMAIAVTRIFFL